MSNKIILLLSTLLASMPLFAQDSADSQQLKTIVLNVNTVWVVTAGALVFLMQAGFALVESGMVRSKNVVNVMMKNYTDVCAGSLIFWLLGYGLLMGENSTGFIGLSHFMPTEMMDWDWTLLFFQMMFAATAVTIASGAMAERVHFGAYIFTALIVCGVIYPIFASWVWGGAHGGAGWLASLGFVDFAGSTVVHSIGGWVALAGIVVLGPRLGRFAEDGQVRLIQGHNMSLVALGGFLLWFGWFGFNAGSALEASASLGIIALNTHLAACAAAVGSIVLCWMLERPILLSRTINSSLGGLVAITAGCATMNPLFATLTGLLAAFFIVFGEDLLNYLRIDDVVGAVPVHAFCGAWGTLAAGIFYSDDLFNLERIGVQALGVFAAFIWGFVLSWLLYKLVDSVGNGLRAGTLQEQRGLDSSEHAEIGYPEFQQEVLFNTEALEHRRTGHNEY